jgi:hypothetical protein
MHSTPSGNEMPTRFPQIFRVEFSPFMIASSSQLLDSIGMCQYKAIFQGELPFVAHRERIGATVAARAVISPPSANSSSAIDVLPVRWVGRTGSAAWRKHLKSKSYNTVREKGLWNILMSLAHCWDIPRHHHFTFQKNKWTDTCTDSVTLDV